MGAGKSCNVCDFYPRSPCGERLCSCGGACARLLISIHALLAESDESTTGILCCNPIFLSTLSLRRATKSVQEASNRTAISIHALLAESDVFLWWGVRKAVDFYPRSPCGERPLRHSVNCSCRSISIHALLAESDMSKRLIQSFKLRFLSTLSLRRATPPNLSSMSERLFLSTLSLRRATSL